MDTPKARGCLADIVLPLYFASLIIGLMYIGSILGVLFDWLDQMPGILRQTGSDGISPPIWFYAGKLVMWMLIWFGSAALYVLKRWGLFLACFGFIGLLALDLIFGARWVVSAVLMTLPILLILISRGYIFQHRADALPPARKLAGWDDQEE